MEKEFIPYELALRLKQLGFNEPCFAFFNGKYHDWLIDDNNGLETPTINPNKNVGECVKRPTFSQAFRWFREKYNLDKIIDNWTEQPMNGEIWDKAYQYYINGEAYHPYFKTHEEAEQACLVKLIDIVENK
jgi:hypothetical protein